MAIMTILLFFVALCIVVSIFTFGASVFFTLGFLLGFIVRSL